MSDEPEIYYCMVHGERLLYDDTMNGGEGWRPYSKFETELGLEEWQRFCAWPKVEQEWFVAFTKSDGVVWGLGKTKHDAFRDAQTYIREHQFYSQHNFDYRRKVPSDFMADMTDVEVARTDWNVGFRDGCGLFYVKVVPSSKGPWAIFAAFGEDEKA